MSGSLFGVWEGRVIDASHLDDDPVLKEWTLGLSQYAPQNRTLAVMAWDGFLLLDDSVDIVDMAREYMQVLQGESCGKCVPCRMGTRVASDILRGICEGKGREEDIDALRQIGVLVRDGSMCEIGHTGMNALLAMLDEHEDRFREAIREGRPRPRGTYHHKVTAPCIEACPERLDVPRYIEYIRSGRYADSLSVIHEKNPLAAVCGRVCVRFCEFACRRGKLDDPVDIKHLKRFVSDVEMDAAIKHYEPVPHRLVDAQRIAIIGAGPAGMTCAYHLLRKGFQVDIFEALHEPGGMAAVGIPDYRLPRDVLRKELEVVQQMGGQVHYGRVMGQDFELEDLRRQGYAAVFVAIGAQKGSAMRVKGEEQHPEGYMPGVEFLRRLNLGQEIKVGSKAVVVGGGNVAMDCARSALRLGVKQVDLVYRRNREAMPADIVEIMEAEDEGVKYHFLSNPTRLMIKEGRVVGVECVRMKLGEPDASGRRRPVPIEGSDYQIGCDMVIPAIGQKVDTSCLEGDCLLDLTRWNTIDADSDTLQTSVEGIFAGGDCVSGPATLIEAMAAGLRAANSIEQYTREGRVTLSDDERMSRVYRSLSAMDPTDNVDRLGRGEGRIEMPTRSVAERVDDFDEIEEGLSPEDALLEADRCLRCYRIVLVATEN